MARITHGSLARPGRRCCRCRCPFEARPPPCTAICPGAATAQLFPPTPRVCAMHAYGPSGRGASEVRRRLRKGGLRQWAAWCGAVGSPSCTAVKAYGAAVISLECRRSDCPAGRSAHAVGSSSHAAALRNANRREAAVGEQCCEPAPWGHAHRQHARHRQPSQQPMSVRSISVSAG